MLRRSAAVLIATKGTVHVNRSRYPLVWIVATVIWQISMVAQAAVSSGGHWGNLLHPGFVFSVIGVTAGSLLGKSVMGSPPWDGAERRQG